ncbi:MAG: PH domain-containing protein [Deinococcales bacterium]
MFRIFRELSESDEVQTEKGKRFWRHIQLLDGEEIKLQKSWEPSFFLNTIYWSVAMVFTLGLSIPFFLLFRWARKRNRWMLTNRRLLSRLGVFNRRSVAIELSDVIDTQVKRPLATTFLGRGLVEIQTRAGGEGPEMVIDMQHNPDDIRNKIATASEEEQKRLKGQVQSQKDQMIEAILTAKEIERQMYNSPDLRSEFLKALLEYDQIKAYQESQRRAQETSKQQS